MPASFPLPLSLALSPSLSLSVPSRAGRHTKLRLHHNPILKQNFIPLKSFFLCMWERECANLSFVFQQQPAALTSQWNIYAQPVCLRAAPFRSQLEVSLVLSDWPPPAIITLVYVIMNFPVMTVSSCIWILCDGWLNRFKMKLYIFIFFQVQLEVLKFPKWHKLLC